MKINTYFAVTGIIKNKDKILILKKSSDDRNYPDYWSFCSGYVKEFESGENTILREIMEETGLKANIMKTGKVIEVVDPHNREHPKRFIIATYLCKAHDDKVKLCKENQDFRWVRLQDLKEFKFVPGLTKDLKSLGLI